MNSKHLTTTVEALAEQIAALRAENTAMREALEEIRSLQSCTNARCSKQYPCDACKTYDIAEAALNTTPPAAEMEGT